MAKECTLGFSFIGKAGQTTNITLTSGVNPDFPEDVWAKIKDYAITKRLLKIGALAITERAPEAEGTVQEVDVESLAGINLADAYSLIEATHDLDQLRKWDNKDSRIRIKNAIARRINQITNGDA